MTAEELRLLDAHVCQFNKVWVPMRWAYNIVHDARVEGRIQSDYLYHALAKVGISSSPCQSGAGVHGLAHQVGDAHRLRLDQRAARVHAGSEHRRQRLLRRLSHRETVTGRIA